MPQTQEEVLDHIDSLLGDLVASVRREIKKFLESGARTREENDYGPSSPLYMTCTCQTAAKDERMEIAGLLVFRRGGWTPRREITIVADDRGHVK